MYESTKVPSQLRTCTERITKNMQYVATCTCSQSVFQSFVPVGVRVTLYGSARVSRHDVVKIAQNITRNHSQNCSLEPVQHTSTCSRAGRAVEDFCIDILSYGSTCKCRAQGNTYTCTVLRRYESIFESTYLRYLRRQRADSPSKLARQDTKVDILAGERNLSAYLSTVIQGFQFNSFEKYHWTRQTNNSQYVQSIFSS